ncbi:MAG: 4-alpha-glucanotransferase [Dehalococcoidia bacterium]
MSADPDGAAKRIPRPLAALARRYGVQTGYHDIDGHRQTASPDILVAVLRSLGAAVSSAADAPAALREDDHRRTREWLAPAHVAWDGTSDGVPLRPPADARALRCTLLLASGEETRWTADASSLLQAGRGQTTEGHWLSLPGPLPAGYHRLVVEAASERRECLLISAPSRCFTLPPAGARTWGIFTPLYGLHSARNPDAGDFGDLAALTEWVAARGGSTVGTLPLLATSLYGPVEPSPYAPLSRRFWNELYVDIDAAGGSRIPPSQPAMRPGDAIALVDYERVATERRAALEPLATRFFAGGGRDLPAFQDFLQAHPLVERYARFRATWERHGTPWQSWPARMRAGTLERGDYDDGASDFHLFAQWLAASQLESLAAVAGTRGVHLYLDLPLGVHPDGFDAWDEQGLFAPGLSVGAPPDGFFTSGQDWGFAPTLTEAARGQSYRYFRQCLEHHLRVAGTLRIDHVMGLHRLFCIPHGARPVDGVYVRYPADELYAVLSVESHRHMASISGEDLGTVPRYVRSAMARHNVARSYVLQFDIHPAGQRALGPVPRHAVAAVNTHDMVPFAGFLEGDDLDRRLDLGLLGVETLDRERTERAALVESLRRYLEHAGLLDPSDDRPLALYRACLAWLARTPAELVLATLEDFWGERQPQNVPGTTTEYPNWRRRLRLSLEELQHDPDVAAAVAAIQRRAR